MRTLIKTMLTSKSAASATEYALIIAALGGLVVAGTTSFGRGLNTALTNNGKALQDASSGTF